MHNSSRITQPMLTDAIVSDDLSMFRCCGMRGVVVFGEAKNRMNPVFEESNELVSLSGRRGC